MFLSTPLSFSKREVSSIEWFDPKEALNLPLVSGEYDKLIRGVLDYDQNTWEKLNEIRGIVDEYTETLEGRGVPFNLSGDITDFFTEKESFSLLPPKNLPTENVILCSCSSN